MGGHQRAPGTDTSSLKHIALTFQFADFANIFANIFNLICIMSLVAHWSGCIQFLVPMLNGFPDDSWVAINELQVARRPFHFPSWKSIGLLDYLELDVVSSVISLLFKLLKWLRLFCTTFSYSGSSLGRAILVGLVQSHVSHAMHWLWPFSTTKSDWYVADHAVYDQWCYLLRHVPGPCHQSNPEPGFVQEAIQRKGKCKTTTGSKITIVKQCKLPVSSC